MKRSELAHKTKDVIVEQGWTQGSLNEPVHAGDKTTFRVCLIGGVYSALFGAYCYHQDARSGYYRVGHKSKWDEELKIFHSFSAKETCEAEDFISFLVEVTESLGYGFIHIDYDEVWDAEEETSSGSIRSRRSPSSTTTTRRRSVRLSPCWKKRSVSRRNRRRPKKQSSRRSRRTSPKSTRRTSDRLSHFRGRDTLLVLQYIAPLTAIREGSHYGGSPFRA
jgi:hypothetical protein